MTGEPLALKDIVKLNFAKSGEGEYICPMLKKVFTDHTHIVAIRPSGNVFCWEVSHFLCCAPCQRVRPSEAPVHWPPPARWF